MSDTIKNHVIKQCQIATTDIFTQWHGHIQRIVNANQTSLITKQLARHTQDRMRERGIIVKQIEYVLTHQFEITHIETTSRKNIFKFRIKGKDFDGQSIAMVIAPGIFIGNSSYKIFTVFYPNKKDV